MKKAAKKEAVKRAHKNDLTFYSKSGHLPDHKDKCHKTIVSC